MEWKINLIDGAICSGNIEGEPTERDMKFLLAFIDLTLRARIDYLKEHPEKRTLSTKEVTEKLVEAAKKWKSDKGDRDKLYDELVAAIEEYEKCAAAKSV